MGFLDRLLGRSQQPSQPQGYGQQGYGQQQGYRVPAGYQQPGTDPYGQDGSQQPGAQPGGQGGTRSADDQAIARYRYLLRTAPPEAIEQAHAEAFAQLTPQQRQQVLGELSRDLPAGERPTSDDPQTLARTATRAELRQPGYMERAFGGGSMMGMGGMGGMGGMSMGRMVMGSMLGSIAGMVIGTAIADSMMGGFDAWDHATDGGLNDGQGFDQGNGFSGDQGGQDGQGYDGQNDVQTGGQGADGQGDAGYGSDTAGYDTGSDAGYGTDTAGYDAGSGGGFDMGGGDGGFGGDSFGGFDGGGFDGGFDSF